MANRIESFGIIILLTFANIAFGQTDEEIALKKGQEAVQLMDNGQLKESIKLLKEAQKLHPENFDYPYELAIAYYLDENYKGAIKVLEKIKSHKNVSQRLYQLLGNCYDMAGEVEEAFKAYDEGLEKYPNSGMIYLEKGNIFWAHEQYDDAIYLYEKGIEVDPSFPSNYYRATLHYCNTTEEVWGMIYGEIFMNLERNSARTAEISALLYDTYESEITFTSENEFTVSFSQMMTINIGDMSDTNAFKLPFGMMGYEGTLMFALLDETGIDLNSLDRLRTKFNVLYYKNKTNEDYPNALFDYQKKVLDAGHFEAYNHWLLMKGDEDAFNVWLAENEELWKPFITWFTDNGLVLSDDNKFYSGQY